MLKKPTVRVLPLQAHCLAFGGFELQMIAAMKSVQDVGVDIAPLDIWKREADFDILHLWGLELQHRNNVMWAHLAKKKILISTLVNYPSLISRLRYAASSLIGQARLSKPMLAQIDGITAVNRQQKQFLENTIGFPSEKVFVIPNIVEDIFFAVPKNAEGFQLDIDNYVICAGNICKRKNQLALVKACIKIGVPLLLVGHVLNGEENYGRAVNDAMANNPNIRWIKGLMPGSTQLAVAYGRAAVFALPSFDEAQPISALEAVAARKPLVLADRPYSKQEFYANAVLTNPDSVDSIASAIAKALDHPDAYCTPIAVIEECRRNKVGKAYFAAYQKLHQ
jgi:glycosyltransferase involved in cell wall biosynthesis